MVNGTVSTFTLMVPVPKPMRFPTGLTFRVTELFVQPPLTVIKIRQMFIQSVIFFGVGRLTLLLSLNLTVLLLNPVC